MAQLDPYLHALVRQGASSLLLQGGEPPAFDFDGQPRPVSRQALERNRVLSLLGEIAGPEVLSHLKAMGSVSLPLTGHQAGSFRVDAELEATTVSVRFTPQGTAPAPTGGSVPAPHPTAPSTSAASASATSGTPKTAPGEGASSPAEARTSDLEIDRLLRLLVERGASDLHVSTGEKPMLRLDGDLTRLEEEAELTAESAWRLLKPLLPERLSEEWEASHDVDFAHEIPGLARFRCNFFLDRLGPGGVFRVIPARIMTVEDLGLSPHILRLCRLTRGLILVTGPTGSGKTTTLTALVDYINRTRNEHIITIEDPIEFVHPNRSCLINQRQVGEHTLTFKAALRAALREDPDIVLVGEMRDLETVAIAIETAETGHLVFGTLHTSTAVSTVDRVVDQFPADRQDQIRVMLSESLRGIISQTLCRKRGGGRVAALEVLLGIPAVANLIREGKSFQIPSLMQTGRKHGMVTLNDALMDLVARKLITFEEAYLRAVEKVGMLSALKSAGADLSFLERGESG